MSNQKLTAKGSSAKPSVVTRPAGRPSAEEERHRMVAEAAYYRAEKRGFRGGDPDRDWVEAEAEIETLLTERKGRTRAPTSRRRTERSVSN